MSTQKKPVRHSQDLQIARRVAKPRTQPAEPLNSGTSTLGPAVPARKKAAPDHGILYGGHYQTLQNNLAGSRNPYTAAEIPRASLRQDTNAFLRTGNPLFALRALAESLQSGGPIPAELVTYFVNSVFFTWDAVHHMINGSEGAPSASKAAELFVDYFAINGGRGRSNAFAAAVEEHQVASRKRQERKAVIRTRDETFIEAKKMHGKGKIKLAVKDTEDKLGVGRTTAYDAAATKRRKQGGLAMPKGPARSK